MAELKPCPFCGGEANVKHHSNNFIDWWEVECSNCHVSQNERYEYEFEAVAAWNTRKPMEAVVAELEKAESRELFDYKDRGATYMIPVENAISIVLGKE